MPFRKNEFIRIYNDLKERDEILSIRNEAATQLGYSRQELTESQKNIIGVVDGTSDIN
jgi:adenosine/AMP kinase